MKEYTFRVILVARGETVEEAWKEATLNFQTQIPTAEHTVYDYDYDEEEIEEPDQGLAGIPC